MERHITSLTVKIMQLSDSNMYHYTPNCKPKVTLAKFYSELF